MKSSTRVLTGNLWVTFAAVLSIAASGAWAADAAPAAPAATTAPATPAAAPAAAPSANPSADAPEELDQIVVRGENLVKAISDAEDNFYSLYNKLNKDDDYDTSCVYLALDSNSQIKSRVCIPGFMADAMADWAEFKVRCQPPTEGGDEFTCLDRNKDNRLSMQEASARPQLEFEFQSLDSDKNGTLDRQEFQAATLSDPPGYQPPPPQLVLMERSKAWYTHMLKVTNSDPRLAQMAGHLDDLYSELNSIQRKYMTIKSSELPDQTKRHETGPRSH